MKTGDKVDDFLGNDQNGNPIRLSDFPGKTIALYFYPKDMTSGCTAQACNLRDNREALAEAGYQVIGVSVDSEASHRKFIEKNELNFPLIADTDHRLVEKFGVWAEKSMYGRKYMGTLRTTFIISPDGVVERIIGPKEVKTKNHASQILALCLCLLCTLTSFGWGQKGHDVTAAIAEAHLTPEASAMVDDLLDGKSMIYWANWLDNASYQPEYRYTKTWHYKNVNKGVRYEEMGVDPSGDAVTAIKSRIEILTDTAATREDKILALKILIHVVGDLHQPMHMGHATDLGGNRIKVKFFDRETNLHSVWDTSLPDAAHKWSYTEWVKQLDRTSPEKEQAIVFPTSYPGEPGTYAPGLIDSWAKETVEIVDSVYDRMPEKTVVGYDEIAWSAPIIEDRFLAGGLRLAFLLNDIAKRTAKQ